jgi:hypothetical protein
MLGTILLVVVAVIVAILLYGATRPSAFRVQRSVELEAPPEQVFPLLEDFHRWGAWSPWEKIDPNLRRTFTGPEKGVGAAYAWEGNKKVGKGRMEITDAAPPSKLTIQLDFLAPFEAHNVTTFVLDRVPAGTRLDWIMEGSHQFMGKVMGIFMNMDQLIGKDFEAGLANLKAEVER